MTYQAIPPSTGGSVITTPLIAAAQNIDVSPLAGDTDGDYGFFAKFVLAGADVITLQPNGSDPSSAFSLDLFATAAGATGTNSLTSNIKIASTGVAATVVVEGTLTSKSGRIRNGRTNIYVDAGTDAAAWINYEWLDTATVITSLRFHGTGATSLGIGSFVRLYKLGHTG